MTTETATEIAQRLLQSDAHIVIAIDESEVYAVLEGHSGHIVSAVAELMKRQPSLRDIIFDATVQFLQNHKEEIIRSN